MISRRYLQLLAVALVGYLAFGRTFAYLGAKPIYVGEVVTAAGALLVLLKLPNTANVFRLPLAWILAAFMALGLVRIVPDIGRYGDLALRDGVIWGYGIAAFATAAALYRQPRLDAIIRWYGTFAKIFPFWLIISAIAAPRLGNIRCPWGNGFGYFTLRPTEAGVTLATNLAFAVFVARPKTFSLFYWLTWFTAFAVYSSGSRGAFVAVLSVSFMILLHAKTTRWARILGALILLVYPLAVTQVEVPVAGQTHSIEKLLTVVGGISMDKEKDVHGGTVEWRLEWWKKIVGYTFQGKYFWTGKGFGLNLADDDGFQVLEDRSLRSPHNSHLTVLARMGVPGFAAWIFLQIGFASAMWLKGIRHKLRNNAPLGNLYLFVLSAWLASVANASFDVALESPQSGIWFWSLIGFGMSLMLNERMIAPAPRQSKIYAARG